MGNLFGKSSSKAKVSRVTEQDKAVLVSSYLICNNCRAKYIDSRLNLQQLKQQRDKLKQYQKRIELQLEKDREMAKKCLATGRKE